MKKIYVSLTITSLFIALNACTTIQNTKNKSNSTTLSKNSSSIDNTSLSKALMTKKGLSENELIKILKKNIDKNNDLSAMRLLAEIYESNNNFHESLFWYKKLADMDDAKAQYRLGQLYYHGNSSFNIQENEQKAIKLFFSSANKAYAPAEFAISTAYRNGRGVLRDYKKAFEWANKAAEHGDINAQNNLGMHYKYGLGVKKSDTKALFWFKKAAEQGSHGAQSNLGDLYEKGGIGVKQDYQKSLYWNRKSAEQGGKTGLFNMGYMYENGLGVEKNLDIAKKWYAQSCQAGDNEACDKVVKTTNK